MSASLLAILELLLMFGLVLWFGVAQLRALRRDERPDEAKTRRAARPEDKRDDAD
jgi:hypothetical protein